MFGCQDGASILRRPLGRLSKGGLVALWLGFGAELALLPNAVFIVPRTT